MKSSTELNLLDEDNKNINHQDANLLTNINHENSEQKGENIEIESVNNINDDEERRNKNKKEN